MIRESSSALARIRKAVDHLLVPSLSPLQELLTERKEIIQAQRSEQTIKLEQIRDEGFEAAARLMLPDGDQLDNAEVPYFKQIVSLRGSAK